MLFLLLSSILTIYNINFFLHHFFYILSIGILIFEGGFLADTSNFSYLCKRILSIDEVSQPTNTNSLSARCKTFARTRQDFAPPAARHCHGRGKLVTPYLSPCSLGGFPLLDAVFSPWFPLRKFFLPHEGILFSQLGKKFFLTRQQKLQNDDKNRSVSLLSSVSSSSIEWKRRLQIVTNWKWKRLTKT